MRVLYIISGLSMGGAERQVVLLSRELTRQGHAVSIYTLNRLTDRLAELRGSPVEVVVDQKLIRLDPAVIGRLRSFIRRWQPDMVHGFLYDGNLYARLAGARTGVPVLNSERSDNYAISWLQRLGLNLTKGLSKGVIANSQSGARFARPLHQVSSDRVHIVWNGIDLEEIDTRLKCKPSTAVAIWPGEQIKRLCIVGAIKPAKDYPLALRVFRELVNRDASWRLICVGDELSLGASGDEKRLVTAECGRLALGNHVKFVGLRNDVPEIIASSDVLLMTSKLEGFPNAVLEAMACGTPVTSTLYADVRRILPMTWQVVASREPALLADAVERCCANRAAVGTAQRAWVEAHATASASAKRMLSVYAQHLPGGANTLAPVA